MMEGSPVVPQELAGADLITYLFVKIFPSFVPSFGQYPDIAEDQPNRGYDKFFRELSDK